MPFNGHPHWFDGKDLKKLRADSHDFHVRYLLGVPDEWEGHEGDILIVSSDDPHELVFAGLAPTGVIVTEKVRIDPLEPAKYLGDLVDNDTIVIIGSTNNKRIAVSEQFLKKTGGHMTGDITFDPGATVDGVDISEIYNYFLDKNTTFPQTIAGPVTFNGYVTFNGGTNLSGGGGISTFKGLTDTPNDYTGQGGKYVRVKTSEDGIEFVAGAGGGISVQTEIIALTSTHITNKQLPLLSVPIDNQSVIIHIVNGLPGSYAFDFVISSNNLSWNGRDWDGILEASDILMVTYWY